MTKASKRIGAVMVSRPALVPFLKVSVAIKIIVGPGMEATEKPMAKARGKVTIKN